MIFGNAAPKFQVSAVDVLLDFAVIEKDEIDYKTLEPESGLNRARKFITKPEHHVFQVLIHLHRYQDPKAKHDEIVAHLNATCQLWRHQDGQAFQDTGSADADFILIEYQHVYITTTDYADGLRLLFKSIDVIDHSDFGDNWTFARALTSGSSNAWYLDPTSGLMVVAPNTTTSRRLVKGRYKGTAILIEGPATNIITIPSDYTDAGYVKSGITAANATLETLDPRGAGNNAASRLLTTAPNGTATWTSGTVPGSFGASGVWLKSSSGNVAGAIFIAGSTGGTQNKTITLTPDWQLFFINRDISSFTGFLQYALRIDPDATVVYVWGTMLDNVNSLIPSIVDPVASAVATRATELITHPSANIINRDKGTISFWFKPKWGLSNLGANFSLFHSGASTANGHVSIRMLSSSILQCQIFTLNGTSLGTDLTPTISSDITQDAWTHLVFAYDSTKANGTAIYLNNVLKATSGSEFFSVSEVDTTFAIGSLLDGTNPAFCEIDELFIDDEVWTAEEVLAVFNLPNGLPRTLI